MVLLAHSHEEHTSFRSLVPSAQLSQQLHSQWPTQWVGRPNLLRVSTVTLQWPPGSLPLLGFPQIHHLSHKALVLRERNLLDRELGLALP